MCLFYQSRDRGLFRIPKPIDGDDTRMEINEREREELLGGIDFDKTAHKISQQTIHLLMNYGCRNCPIDAHAKP
jgi:hypothetical protein